MNTYYELLGLQPGASQIEIKKAYFKMIRQHSPESDPEQFQKIREAYEQLKQAEQAPQGPSFAPFSNSLAEKMYAQIETYRRSKNKTLFRDACEEAWARFPDDIQFLYLLIIAQRQCGNTGKAVKNAELLVSKDEKNKWFHRELAISYMERGFTKKAFHAFQNAYTLGCRDADFILTYSVECNEYGDYQKGAQILLELIHQKKKWSKNEVPELFEAYIGLLIMNCKGDLTHYPEIIEGICQMLEQYKLYLTEYVQELAMMLSRTCIHDIEKTGENDRKTEQAFTMMRNICHTDSEKEYLDFIREKYILERLEYDPRICDTLKYTYNVYFNCSDIDPYVKRFALLDMQLCIIEERTEIFRQAEIIRNDYPDYYEKLQHFLSKLESEKNLAHIKESLQRDYRRIDPDLVEEGFYYRKYPQERVKAQGTIINDGLETYIRETKKVGRNDPCPCGSGKKYKHCCMKK